MISELFGTQHLMGLEPSDLIGGVCVFVAVFLIGGTYGINFQKWRQVSERSRWARYYNSDDEWNRAMHCLGCSGDHGPSAPLPGDNGADAAGTSDHAGGGLR